MSDPGKRTSAADRIRGVLSTVPLFHGLDARDEERIVSCARMQLVPAGEVVIERGDPPEAVFAVATGRLKVVAPRSGGRDAALHILGPGDVFGEVALFQTDGRTARVAAIEESVLLVIDHRDFRNLLDRSADLTRRMLVLLATRLKNTIAHFDATTSLEVPQRLARKLLLLTEHCGTADPGGTRLGLKLSQSDLAELVDATRQSVNRLLRAWHEARILETRDGRIVVRDVEGLRRIAG
jgi:CRP/FNR family cyclic AMP-dependent transcriptional regulator